MRVVLDFDDIMDTLPVPVDRLDRLASIFPRFKVTLFAIPGKHPVLVHRPYIQYGVHGWTHEGIECKDWTAADCDLSRGVVGRGYAPVFRAPRWGISDEAIEFFTREGIIVCLHPTRPCPVKVGEKMIYRAIKNPDQWRPDGTVQLLHGHIGDDQLNGIAAMQWSIEQMPRDCEFFYITQYVAERRAIAERKMS